jgi:HAE1 family hydrophobic/amphiphilic exporter-1
VNLSAPFIGRPVATSLISTAIAFLGLAAFPFLPIAPLPQVDFPTVQVTATLAGASAERRHRSQRRSSARSARPPASPR